MAILVLASSFFDYTFIDSCLVLDNVSVWNPHLNWSHLHCFHQNCMSLVWKSNFFLSNLNLTLDTRSLSLKGQLKWLNLIESSLTTAGLRVGPHQEVSHALALHRGVAAVARGEMRGGRYIYIYQEPQPFSLDILRKDLPIASEVKKWWVHT